MLLCTAEYSYIWNGVFIIVLTIKIRRKDVTPFLSITRAVNYVYDLKRLITFLDNAGAMKYHFTIIKHLLYFKNIKYLKQMKIESVFIVM